MFLLDFVDTISASPAVRLSLVGDRPWRALADTTFPPPQLRRAVASTLLADGGVVSAAAYDNRTINLSLRVEGADADGAAQAVQNLARELNRERNVLRYQPDTQSPVFFRTFRTDITSIRFDPVDRRVTVTLLAEPFAYGLKETLAPVTVSNNPASGCFFDMAAPKGDLETPLFLSIAQGTISTPDRRQSVIAVRRRGTPSAAPFVLQAESMTTSTDTALGAANDPLLSGAGQNYLRCTFATSTAMGNRATIDPWPAAASDDVRGTYRTYVRTRKTVGSDVVSMRLAWGGAGSLIFNDIATLRVATGAVCQYVDLGLVQFPLGADPVTDGYSGDDLAARGLYFEIDAARTSGTGSLDIDCLLFMPADDKHALVSWAVDSAATAFVLDAARTMPYAVGAAGEMRTAGKIEIAGALPMITPGVTNRVAFMQDTGQLSSGGDLLANSTTITPYYWPRYLHVRPATT